VQLGVGLLTLLTLVGVQDEFLLMMFLPRSDTQHPPHLITWYRLFKITKVIKNKVSSEDKIVIMSKVENSG